MRKYLIPILLVLFILIGTSAWALTFQGRIGATACAVEYPNLDEDYGPVDGTGKAYLMYRTVMPASSAGCDGTQISVRICGHTTLIATLTSMAVGEQDGVNLDDYAAADTPVAITWGGSVNTTVPADASRVCKQSDWVPYDWTDANAHLLHVTLADGDYGARDNGWGGQTIYFDYDDIDTYLTDVFNQGGTTTHRQFVVDVMVE